MLGLDINEIDPNSPGGWAVAFFIPLLDAFFPATTRFRPCPPDDNMTTPYSQQPMMNQPTGGSAPAGAPPGYAQPNSMPNMQQQQPQQQPMQPQMTGGGQEPRPMSMAYPQQGQSQFQPQYQQQQQQYPPQNMGYQQQPMYSDQKGMAPQGYQPPQPGMQQQQYMQPGFQQPQFVPQQQPQFMQPQFTGAAPMTNVININNNTAPTAVVPIVYACAGGHTPYTPVPITGILWAVLCFPIGLICLFSEMQTRCSVCGAML
jgi:hypothetical protein